MPKEIFLKLQKVVVGGQKLRISRASKAHVQKLRKERERFSKRKKDVRHEVARIRAVTYRLRTTYAPNKSSG